MTTKTTPEVASEEKKEKKTRKPREPKVEKIIDFSLVGKKPEKQREIIQEAIDYYQKELDKWKKKLQDINKKLDDSDWKKLTERFSREEINKRLQQQEN